MGLRGPAPAPTALKIMRGNPGKRALNHSEPQPGEFTSDPPPHLDDEAVAEWKRLVPILQRMKVLTEADYIALATLCQAYSTMSQAQKQLRESGLLYKTRTGHVSQSPLLSIVNQNAEIVMRHLREFGMTPSSRSRLSVDKEAPKQDHEWAL